MKKVIFLLICSLISGYETKVVPRGDSYCHSNVACVTYTIIPEKSTNAYEYRRYHSSKWVATNHIAANFTPEVEAMMTGRLIGYFDGQNTNNAVIGRTLPKALRVAPNLTAPGMTFFIMYLMVPPEHRANTPGPTDSSLYIQDVPPFNAFVRSFPGQSSFSQRQQQLASLQSDIGDQSLFYSDYFLLAEYSSGQPNSSTRNEVWLVSKEHVLQNVQ